MTTIPMQLWTVSPWTKTILTCTRRNEALSAGANVPIRKLREKFYIVGDIHDQLAFSATDRRDDSILTKPAILCIGRCVILLCIISLAS
ncbi:MAG: hypothetical protein KDB03_21395 [Planctomycetales bacterium]|nr:hypothetical protein [Planctomycetales bacterium]